MMLRISALFTLATATLSLAAQSSSSAADLKIAAERQLPALTDTYMHLHENPELSKHEVQTAAFVSGELRKLDMQ